MVRLEVLRLAEGLPLLVVLEIIAGAIAGESVEVLISGLSPRLQRYLGRVLPEFVI